MSSKRAISKRGRETRAAISRSAPVTPAAANKAKTRTATGTPRAPVKNLLAELEDAKSKKQEDSHIQVAKRESKKEAYRYFETDLLYWWGYQIEEWSFPVTSTHDREALIEALVGYDDLNTPSDNFEGNQSYVFE